MSFFHLLIKSKSKTKTITINTTSVFSLVKIKIFLIFFTNVSSATGMKSKKIKLWRKLTWKVTCIFIFFCFFIIILKGFIYLFLERREQWEKERDRNINVWLRLACPQLGTWPTTQACALPGNPASDPLVHRLALNPLSHTSQGIFKKHYKSLSKLRVSERYSHF